jgi:hypothetical protein
MPLKGVAFKLFLVKVLNILLSKKKTKEMTTRRGGVVLWTLLFFDRGC